MPIYLQSVAAGSKCKVFLRRHRPSDCRSVRPGTGPANVTIEIFVGDSPNALRWNVRSELSGVKLAGNSAIRSKILGSPKEFQAEVKLAVESDDGSGAIGQVLVGIGRNVSRAIPAQVWNAVRRASKSVDGRPLDILILSEEPYVPWELAVPEPPLTDDVAPFLGAQAKVGRWLLGELPPAPAQPRRVVVARGRDRQADRQGHRVQGRPVRG
jgi:hypothetical protein